MTTELKERFALADEVGSPELWGEARRRAAAAERQPSRPDRVGFGPGGRRIMTAAVAFAVFAAATVFAWELSHPDAVPKPPPPAEQPPDVDLAGELGPGWTELPPPPEVRSGAATAWTDSRLITWGGFVFGGGGDKPSTDDGFVFDAATQDWSPLPPSPLVGRSLPASAWTGREFLVWGGVDLNNEGLPGFDDGAAFDPSTGHWRSLPPAPIEGRAPMSVWTGEELIVWGTAVRVTPRPRDGAAYDPATNTWRRIADAPIELTDATAVWTGEEMIVFGAALHGGNESETETAIGAAYDSEQDTWRELPPSELSPQASTAAWTGHEMVAWDYLNGTAAYDPVADRWRDLSRVPIDDYECTPQSVAIPGEAVFGNYCGITPVFSVAKDRWRDVTREDLSGWVLEPAAAGSAVLVLGHSLELSEEPNVTFDTRMLAWAPPSRVDEVSPFVPPSETVGDATKLPVVFPDGRRVTLMYPTHLQLATLGVQPDVSYSFGGRYQGWIVFLHDPNASIRPYLEPGEGSMLINSAEGGLEVFPARGEEPGYWIDVELPSWRVLISIEPPGGGAAKVAGFAVQVAAALDVRETAGGFPVVEASGEAELAEGAGNFGGPQLAFGDLAPDPEFLSGSDPMIFLSPDGCDPARTRAFTDGRGSTCLGDGEVAVDIQGDREFVTAVQQGLVVELPSASAKKTPFLPEHTVTGDETRMPVVFPDGTEATVIYPTQLELASLGVQPQVSYLWKDDPPPRFPILFLHDRDAPIQTYVEGAEPAAVIDGDVEIWTMSDRWERHRNQLQGTWIRFRLPSWTVLAAATRVEDAIQVARALQVEEHASGFPVVTASGPIALSHESGEGEGPMLSIGSVGERAVLLWIEGCGWKSGVDEVLDSGAYGSACLADGRVTADIYGDPSAVEAIVEGLRIEGYRPAA